MAGQLRDIDAALSDHYARVGQGRKGGDQPNGPAPNRTLLTAGLTDTWATATSPPDAGDDVDMISLGVYTLPTAVEELLRYLSVVTPSNASPQPTSSWATSRFTQATGSFPDWPPPTETPTSSRIPTRSTWRARRDRSSAVG
jgi:hypothetical protein